MDIGENIQSLCVFNLKEGVYKYVKEREIIQRNRKYDAGQKRYTKTPSMCYIRNITMWEEGKLLLRQKKKERLRILYRCFRRELYLLAYSKLKNAELAEDMVQETFVTVAQNLDHIDEKAYRFLGEYIKVKEKREDITLTQFSREKKDRSHAKAWGYISTILKNKIIDNYRKEKSTALTYVGEYYEGTAGSMKEEPLRILEKEECRKILEEGYQELKSPYKDVIYLRYEKKMTTKEIGRMLQKSEENVRQILSRGKKMLKEKLRKGGYDENLWF